MMIRLIKYIVIVVSSFILLPVYAEKQALGLPECEQIVGVDRHIEIGNTISYTIEYLEHNNYRCEEYKGKVNEVVSCTLQLDHRFEVLLITENGTVINIETLYDGTECSYFTIKPADPRMIDPELEKKVIK